MNAIMAARAVEVPPLGLGGFLAAPQGACYGVVVFAQESGASRLSPRNAHVAQDLNRAGLATLLFDLLSPEEARDKEKSLDVGLLTGRLAELAEGGRLDIIPGATRHFEEPGALDAVVAAARAWFVRHLTGAGTVVR